MADSTQRVFQREIRGKQVTRVTDNPSQIVKFVFDGWTEVTGAEATKAVAAAERDVKAAEKAAAAADKPATTTTTDKK